MIVVEKRNKCCKIIDFAIPYDSRIEEKEVEKVVKYQDLARELTKLWINENSGNSYCNRNIWNSSKGFKEETREYWYRDQDRRASEKCYSEHGKDS